MNENDRAMLADALEIARLALNRAQKAERQRDKFAALLRLTVETLDDDAPGPGTTVTALLWQIRDALAVLLVAEVEKDEER